jgi:hypothetical protein
VFSTRKKASHSTKHTVCDDWIASLPREKMQIFHTVVRGWESSYAMVSISLSESLSLRSRGELIGARQQLIVCDELLARCAVVLIEGCQVILNRGRRISNVPQVLPLNSEFFKGQTAQSAASWNEFLHRVLFADRSRFLQKVKILSETLENIAGVFHMETAELASGRTVQPNESWKTLESYHYDFNTCLREAEVLLKSFLRALPADQIPDFAAEMDVAPSAEKVKKFRTAGMLAHPEYRHRSAIA